MVYYDYYGQEHEFDLSNKIDNGWCGDIYRFKPDWVLKKYRIHCGPQLKLKKETYDIIKEINSDHIVEIGDLLYKKRRNRKNTPIDAYTCKYINPEKIDILSMPTDYLIHSLNEISKVFTEFANHKIKVDDLKEANTIMQKDKIILIDLDLFNKVQMNKEKLNIFNQLSLLYLFKELLSSCVYKYKYNSQFLDSITEIFDNYSEAKDTIKQFQKYKYPADYINAYTKNRH